MNKFTFNEKTHRYYWGDEQMTGVTTIIGVIGKGDGITQWAANCAVDYIEKKGLAQYASKQGEVGGVIAYSASIETFLEARTAWKDERDKAALWGQITHKGVEMWIATKEIPTTGTLNDKEYKIEPEHKEAIERFVKWAEDNKVKFTESEKKMYDPEMFIAGTADFVCEIDGRKYIGDLKTGKSIYYEAFVQCAAYRHLLELMGEKDFNGSIIVHLPQKGELETHERFDHETDLAVFKAALLIYRTKQQI
jgi:hypothetical protein